MTTQQIYTIACAKAAEYLGKEIALDLDTLKVIAIADTYAEANAQAQKVCPDENFIMWNYFDPNTSILYI